MQLVSDAVKPHVDRIRELERCGQHAEAERVAREAIGQFPEDAVLHNNLGCCLANQERFEDAIPAFRRAVTLTHDNLAQGREVPKGYPEEPLQNLKAAEQCAVGNFGSAKPARGHSRYAAQISPGYLLLLIVAAGLLYLFADGKKITLNPSYTPIVCWVFCGWWLLLGLRDFFVVPFDSKASTRYRRSLFLGLCLVKSALAALIGYAMSVHNKQLALGATAVLFVVWLTWSVLAQKARQQEQP